MPENEIVSAQVVFPDNRILDEVYEALMSEISILKENVKNLQTEIEALKEA